MVQGMSYLQLYYDKSCTSELSKDEGGNYFYNTQDISNATQSPYVLNFWCKNNGSHTSYKSSISIASSDFNLEGSVLKETIYPNEIVLYSLKISFEPNTALNQRISMRFSYDSI